MIALQQNSRSANVAEEDWQAKFLKLLPEIERMLLRAFRDLQSEAREEAVQEGIANCLQAFARLHQRGREDQAYAGSLARYAVWQIKSGRQVGCRLNIHDPFSRYAQLHKGIRVERLDHYEQRDGWVDAMIDYQRSSVLDQVALRIDVPQWLKTLTRRTRAIARDLAIGESAIQVAKKYRVTRGRISQIRRELFDSWNDFHNRDSTEPATTG